MSEAKPTELLPERILPCPFCGAAAGDIKLSRGHGYIIGCGMCQGQQFALTRDEAVKLWNTRTHSPAQADYEQGLQDGGALAVATIQDNRGHLNYLFDGKDCCRFCALVRPAEGWTRWCKGPHELALRESPAQAEWLPIESGHLCLVKYDYAYFTTQELERQWGDDWDDAPYEHNAGSPYEPFNEKDGRTWTVYKLKFDGPFETPADRCGGNSRYSVAMINSGAIAWLSTDSWSKPQVSIPAGTSMADFVRLVQYAGGNVYVPLPQPPKDDKQ